MMNIPFKVHVNMAPRAAAKPVRFGNDEEQGKAILLAANALLTSSLKKREAVKLVKDNASLLTEEQRFEFVKGLYDKMDGNLITKDVVEAAAMLNEDAHILAILEPQITSGHDLGPLAVVRVAYKIKDMDSRADVLLRLVTKYKWLNLQEEAIRNASMLGYGGTPEQQAAAVQWKVKIFKVCQSVPDSSVQDALLKGIDSLSSFALKLDLLKPYLDGTIKDSDRYYSNDKSLQEKARDILGKHTTDLWAFIEQKGLLKDAVAYIDSLPPKSDED
jgi:hypothetical protein